MGRFRAPATAWYDLKSKENAALLAGEHVSRSKAQKAKRAQGGTRAAHRSVAAARRLRSDERSELILAAVSEGVYEWTITDNSLSVSPRLREIFGFREGELTSENWN